jgi:hypothetical protein
LAELSHKPESLAYGDHKGQHSLAHTQSRTGRTRTVLEGKRAQDKHGSRDHLSIVIGRKAMSQ